MVAPRENEYESMRKRMVEEQLVPRGIKDQCVLDAFLEVPREIFVPSWLRNEAYYDGPLPTKHGQTISQPYIVACMTEMLELPKGKECKILEVGVGSGYQAAILAYMGHKVIGIDRLSELVEFAQMNLSHLPYGRNVKVVMGDGTLGREEDAPFDGILVTAAAPRIPRPLLDQLAPGGKLVLPIGDLYMQTMVQATKLADGSIQFAEGTSCRFVPLIGKYGFQVK